MPLISPPEIMEHEEHENPSCLPVPRSDFLEPGLKRLGQIRLWQPGLRKKFMYIFFLFEFQPPKYSSKKKGGEVGLGLLL